MFPDTLPPTYSDPDKPGILLGRSEVERRTDYIELLHKQLGKQHSLSQLVCQCLQNDPADRPSAEGLLQQLETVGPHGTYGSLKMEMEKLQVIMMSVLRMETEVGEVDKDIKHLQHGLQHQGSCRLVYTAFDIIIYSSAL